MFLRHYANKRGHNGEEIWRRPTLRSCDFHTSLGLPLTALHHTGVTTGVWV